MSRGSLAFLAIKAALLASIPAFAVPEQGPCVFALAVLVLTLAAFVVLRKRYG